MLRAARIAAVAIAALAFTQGPVAAAPPGAIDETVAKREAKESGTAWLALVDGEKYAESWDQAASLFRKQISRDQWVKTIGAARGGVGKLRGRTFDAAEYIVHEGVPTVILTWKSSFGSASGLAEQVTMMRDDGKWRCAGYFIRPGA
jgi:hypothetical protein